MTFPHECHIYKNGSKTTILLIENKNINEKRMMNEAVYFPNCFALPKITEEILKKYFFQVQKGTSTVGNSESDTLSINTG